MSSFRVLLIRTALAIVIALIVMRFFFPGSGLWEIAVLAAALLGLASIFQYTRRRERDQK